MALPTCWTEDVYVNVGADRQMENKKQTTGAGLEGIQCNIVRWCVGVKRKAEIHPIMVEFFIMGNLQMSSLCMKILN